MQKYKDEYIVIYKAALKGSSENRPVCYGHYTTWDNAKYSLPSKTRDMDYEGGRNGFTAYPDGHYIARIKVY